MSSTKGLGSRWRTLRIAIIFGIDIFSPSRFAGNQVSFWRVEYDHGDRDALHAGGIVWYGQYLATIRGRAFASLICLASAHPNTNDKIADSRRRNSCFRLPPSFHSCSVSTGQWVMPVQFFCSQSRPKHQSTHTANGGIQIEQYSRPPCSLAIGQCDG